MSGPRLDPVLQGKNNIKNIFNQLTKFIHWNMDGRLKYCINVKFIKVDNGTINI